MYTLQKQTDFSRKSRHIARRAWNILRLALLWARKGGLFRNKHRLAISLSVFSKLTRKLIHRPREPRGALVHGDREFSFDDTPIFHVKMRRRSPSSLLRFKYFPHLSCIEPRADLDLDYDGDFICCFRDDDEEEEGEREMNGDCDEGIDLKAEEFIANFYEQMKLQRQISCLDHA